MAGPCAACKVRRRGCRSECVFAPYFPAEDPEKFAAVHRVFGASKLAKFINSLELSQRQQGVDSLIYEAQHRLRDPVFGCVTHVSELKADLAKLQRQIAMVENEIHAFQTPPINPSLPAADDVLASPEAASPTPNSQPSPSLSDPPTHTV